MHARTGRLPDHENAGARSRLHNRARPMGQMGDTLAASADIGEKQVKIG